MHFLNLFKFVCMPCLRFFGPFPKKFSSSFRFYQIPQPKPVPLAFSEYLSDSPQTTTDNPIFIVHGLFGSRTNWNTISKSIAATTKRKVVALDLRNHGDSPHTEEFSYGHMVADLKHLMQELGVKEGKASVLGHSIGGRVAMAMALENPKIVRDLIIVDVSPTGFPPGVNYIPRLLDALESVSLTPGQSLPEARKEAGEQMKKHIKGKKLINFLLTNLIMDEKSKNFVWKINVDSVKKNFSSLMKFPKFLSVYNNPCLFIAGEKSDYLKREDEGEIMKLFPKASFQYVTGAGHLVHSEQPNVFLNHVTTFLDKNLPTSK